ncbi:MAG: hypothetical protein IIA87_03270 [Nanoarchaeota archaeon]|nr:hypothetical protein [Nanoarchaeota archaeon]
MEEQIIEEVTELDYSPKVEKFSDEQKEYVTWMFKQILQKQEDEILKIIEKLKNQLLIDFKVCMSEESAKRFIESRFKMSKQKIKK